MNLLTLLLHSVVVFEHSHFFVVFEHSHSNYYTRYAYIGYTFSLINSVVSNLHISCSIVLNRELKIDLTFEGSAQGAYRTPRISMDYPMEEENSDIPPSRITEGRASGSSIDLVDTVGLFKSIVQKQLKN